MLAHRIEEHAWDWYLRAHTYDHVRLDALGLGPESSDYCPTPYSAGRFLLGRVPPEYRNGAFVDYGCGMGRMLMLAKWGGFNRVIGVEWSERLCDIARHNCRGQCELYQGDATQFDPPQNSSVFFFCNPFFGSVLERVLDRIEQSVLANPRPVLLAVYLRAKFDGAVEDRPWIRRVQEGEFRYPRARWSINTLDTEKLALMRGRVASNGAASL
jgi:SAM-dependent methyltransferase